MVDSPADDVAETGLDDRASDVEMVDGIAIIDDGDDIEVLPDAPRVGFTSRDLLIAVLGLGAVILVLVLLVA